MCQFYKNILAYSYLPKKFITNLLGWFGIEPPEEILQQDEQKAGCMKTLQEDEDRKFTYLIDNSFAGFKFY